MIANSFSWGASLSATTAAAKFQGGGADEASGFLSVASGGCQPAAWLVGTPKLTNTVYICQSFRADCHGCLAASFNGKPMPVGPYTSPIGLPLLFVIVPPNPLGPGNTSCLKVPIPNHPNCRGITVYMAVITQDSGGVLHFSPRLTVTVL